MYHGLKPSNYYSDMHESFLRFLFPLRFHVRELSFSKIFAITSSPPGMFSVNIKILPSFPNRYEILLSVTAMKGKFQSIT